MHLEPRKHKGPVLAGMLVLAGLAILALALFALPRDDTTAPPPVAGPAPTPTATTTTAATRAADRGNTKDVGAKKAQAASQAPDPLASARQAWEEAFKRNEVAHVPAGWVAGFYDLYGRAQRTFGVNWLLLASIHRQETAFSTASSTYHGLNFAHCCAGSMQFNVTNGPTTTWERYRQAYKLADRPKDYPHRTKRHPSVYDDYDAMMAAASLLRDSGAAAALDQTAWQAAYDYYGHDIVGVEYADQVVARAIGWSQSGFSINQAVDPKLIEAVHAAWGAPVVRRFEAAAKARKRAERTKRDRAREKARQQAEGDGATQTGTTTAATTTTTTTTTTTP